MAGLVSAGASGVAIDRSRTPEAALDNAILVTQSTPLAADTIPDSPPPSAGPILPMERIVAFYGNPLARRMGILGELPPDEMLAKLDEEVVAWREADPSTPVRPALHMIAVVASGSPGPDGKYRTRMSKAVIEDVIALAERRDAIVILDIQPGHSTVETELERLIPYLERPNVHLALDPEWRMQDGAVPGKRIGSMHADEVNYAIDVLSRIVEEHGLPPKVLVVHRFTAPMLKEANLIREDPNVQVVLNMDGWGPPSSKINSSRSYVARAPIEFKGFKLFYKNDRKGGSRMMTPEEVLALSPVPIYIQYQ